ncbi:MAG TPA: hypothetical protein VIG61_06655 [Fusobacterium sp.]|uniref:hypothetical protein n=1 Tax=Fusobacterium sp. TaxID=68766 RepID=UPI002F3F0385
MKKQKIIFGLFLICSFLSFAEGEIREIITETANTTTSNVLDKGITAQNEQTLEVKELDTQELLLQNQDLESSSIKITGKALQEQQQQVKVVQNDTLKIEEELAAGVKPKSFWQKIKDFFTGE